MTPEQQQQLAALLERRAKITEAPWRKCGGGTACYMAIYSDAAKQYVVFRMASVRADTESRDGAPIKAPDDDQQADNARFIAHAPADIDLLLSLLSDAERKADDYARDCEILLGAEWRRSVQATNGDPEAAREHRIAALVAELATATERAERAADARQAEIVAWLRKQASIRARASVTTRNPEWSAAHAEVESFCDSAADAIEAGDFKAKGNDDAPRSD